MANIVFQEYKRTFVNDYFIKGWWTDEENNPIRSARVGQKVRFHIQTSPELPFDETFQFQIRDHDGQFFWYTMYDTISINKTGEDKLEFNQTTKLSEIVILEFTFDRNIHEKIDDDFGVEIELYVACRYNFKTTELANTSDTWLNLGYDDSDLFIKPAFPEVQYNLPEVYTAEGDMIVYALIEGAKEATSLIVDDIINTREAKRFITLKVRNLHVRTLGPEGLKKKVFQETIDLSTGKVQKTMPYTVVEANEYYKIKKNKVVSVEATETLETFERDDIRAWDAKTGKIRALSNGLKAWDAYFIVTDMIKLVPNATSNEGMKLPDLSSVISFVPPLAYVSMGIKVMEMTSAHLLKDIEEFIDQQMEAQLQRAKFEGLAAVESLLKTSLGDRKNHTYYFIMETTKEGLEDVLIGKIRKTHLIPKYIRLFSEPQKTSYKLLIKATPPVDSSVSKIFIIDSIYINL